MPGCYIPIYMNKISPAQYRAHYYKEVDQIFILPRFSCASSPTISIDSGDCGSIIFLLIKLKIQTRSNDRFGLKLGTVLAQLGQRACPSWARCLPLLGRFGFRYLPIYGVQPTHAIPSIWQFLSSVNHPDNCLTIARRLTFCLSECYNKKPDNLTVSQKFSFFTKNQRYLHLLLISTNLNPKRSLGRSMVVFYNCLQPFVFYKASFACF